MEIQCLRRTLLIILDVIATIFLSSPSYLFAGKIKENEKSPSLSAPGVTSGEAFFEVGHFESLLYSMSCSLCDVYIL